MFCRFVQFLQASAGIKVKVKFALEQAMEGPDLRARCGTVVIATPRPLYPVPIVLEAGWAPGPVWTGAEIVGPRTEIRSPDRPPRNELLYELRYPGAVN
jgi:hypothetical protein